MKRSAVVLAAMVAFSAAPAQPAVALNPLSHCGTERWHIKTLDDAGAAQVSSAPIAATVTQLRAFSVPAAFNKNNDTSRYAPVEKTEYTVSALLVGFKEEADRDLHVVLADPAHPAHTLIGEVPDPKCSTVIASGRAAQISAVRTAFTKCFGAAPAGGGLKKFSGKFVAKLTGIGFFDVLHGQTGVAPNGIELHPILRIKAETGSCPTGYILP